MQTVPPASGATPSVPRSKFLTSLLLSQLSTKVAYVHRDKRPGASTTGAYSVGTSDSEEGRRFGPGPRDTGGAAVSFARLTGVDHHCDVVSLQQNTTDGLGGPLLEVDFLGVIKDQVHVLVEPDNHALDPEVGVLVQPDLHPVLVLKKPEDQSDGLGHDLLELARCRLTDHCVR